MSTPNARFPSADEFHQANPAWVLGRASGYGHESLKRMREEVLAPEDYKEVTIGFLGASGVWQAKPPCFAYRREALKDARASVNERRSKKLTTNPDEERVYETPEGNRRNLAGFLRRLNTGMQISRVLFFLRQRKGLWPGFPQGRIPSKKLPLPFPSGKKKERTYLDTDADLAIERLQAARGYRIVNANGGKTPPPFVSGDETGWHDSRTYYGTSKDGVTGFWVTFAEAVTRFPNLPGSTLSRMTSHQPSRYLLDESGDPRQVRSMLVPPCPLEDSDRKTRVLFLKDVREVALNYTAAHDDAVQEASKAVFVDENGVKWPTVAQARRIHGVTKKFCQKWARRQSIVDPHRMAMRSRPVPGNQHGPNQSTGYCESDLLNILDGKETNSPGTGTGCSADKLRERVQLKARRALLAILPKGQRMAPSAVHKLAASWEPEDGLTLSPHVMRAAFRYFRGERSESGGKGHQGLDYWWRLPDRAYDSARGVATPAPSLHAPHAPAVMLVPAVVLAGPDDAPIVFGVPKRPLAPKTYHAVKALIDAGEKGLNKDSLNADSDRITLLRRLREKDNDWKDAISFPGEPWGRYRIAQPRPTVDR